MASLGLAMTVNVLLTGPPRSGKSTALERTADALREDGYTVGGIVSPEMRTLGHRVGFELVDVGTDERAVLAHVDRDEGPSVGKYRVDVDAVDRISQAALGETARDAVDVILIDEIAPMEVFSDVFVAEVRACLDSQLPVVGTVHRRGTTGLIGEVKERDDVDVVEVTEANRDALPDDLVERVRAGLGGQA